MFVKFLGVILLAFMAVISISGLDGGWCGVEIQSDIVILVLSNLLGMLRC